MIDADLKTVKMVKHVLGEEETILSFADFQGRLPNVGLDFLTYHGLVSSIMTTRKRKLIKNENTALSGFRFKTMSVILKRG